MIDNDVVARIVKKIRATRLEKKLTIQQLANRTRVSKGLLSKIALSQSLDVSLRDFFKDLVLTDGKGCQMIRREQYLSQPDKHNGTRHHHILWQNLSDSTMEAAIVSIEGGESVKVSTGSGYVFLYAISGSCLCEICDDTVTLNEGDAMCFERSVDRSFKSEVTTTILQFTFATSK